MDRLHSFSRVIVDSTQELCALLVSSYIEKVKETCKNGEKQQLLEGKATLLSAHLGEFTHVKNFLPDVTCV